MFWRIEYGIHGLGKGRQEMESILARNSCTLQDTEIAGVDPSNCQER